MGMPMLACCITVIFGGSTNVGRDAEGIAVCKPEPFENVQVSQWNVASDVVEDFDAGLEYGEAESILKSVQKGDAREYLVR